jgi:hypothetical protein
MFGIDSKSNPTSINTITPCMGLCSCKGIHSSNTCTNASTLVTPFDKILRILCFLHPLVEVDFPPFVDDFHLEMIVTLDRNAFIFNLIHSSCLFLVAFWVWCMNFYGIVLSNDFVNGFDIFSKVCGHIA